MKEFRLTKQQKIKINNQQHRKLANEQEANDRIRQDHIAWCKGKAIELIKAGDAQGALVSFQHNMKTKHQTYVHPALLLIPELILANKLHTATQIQEFIEDFN